MTECYFEESTFKTGKLFFLPEKRIVRKVFCDFYENQELVVLWAKILFHKFPFSYFFPWKTRFLPGNNIITPSFLRSGANYVDKIHVSWEVWTQNFIRVRANFKKIPFLTVIAFVRWKIDFRQDFNNVNKCMISEHFEIKI